MNTTNTLNRASSRHDLDYAYQLVESDFSVGETGRGVQGLTTAVVLSAQNTNSIIERVELVLDQGHKRRECGIPIAIFAGRSGMLLILACGGAERDIILQTTLAS